MVIHRLDYTDCLCPPESLCSGNTYCTQCVVISYHLYLLISDHVYVTVHIAHA